MAQKLQSVTASQLRQTQQPRSYPCANVKPTRGDFFVFLSGIVQAAQNRSLVIVRSEDAPNVRCATPH